LFTNQSLGGVYLLDLDGTILLANPVALNLMDYRGPLIPGLNSNNFLSEDQLDKWGSVLSNIIATGSQKSLVEFVLKRPDGKRVYTESRHRHFPGKQTLQNSGHHPEERTWRKP
jgi:PAS domain S-box-containing protein